MTKNKARQLYKKFFGRTSRNEFKIDLGHLKNMTFLGVPTRIEYFANKKQHGGKDTVYYHDFENEPVLLTNNQGVLIIYDPQIKITDRGIEG